MVTDGHDARRAALREALVRVLEVGDRLCDRVFPSHVAEAAEKIAYAALATRACRVGRAVLVLADSGLDLEAGILMRTLTEYRITVPWLIAEDRDQRFRRFMWDDRNRRLEQDEHHRRVTGRPMLEDAKRTQFAAERDELVASIDGSPGLPGVKRRSIDLGREDLYAAEYRFESNALTHPSGLAGERFMDRDEQAREYRILCDPRPLAHPDPDPCGAAAVALYDVLGALAQLLDDGLTANGLESITVDDSWLTPC